jgi:hypothetical protein
MAFTVTSPDGTKKAKKAQHASGVRCDIDLNGLGRLA